MRRIAMATGALLLAASIGLATGLPNGLPSVPSPSERWYRVEVMGKHAGWASESIADRQGVEGTLRVLESELLIHVVWETDAKVTLKVGPDEYTAPQHFAIDFKQTIRSRIEYDASGLRRSDFRLADRKAKRRVVVERAGTGFTVTVSSGKVARTREVAASAFDATSNAIYELPERWAKVGDAATLRVLDLATGEIVSRTFRVAGREEIDAPEGKRFARRFEVSDAKDAFEVWVDDVGLEVRLRQQTGAATILFDQAGKKEAKDFTPPTFDLDGDEKAPDLRDSV
jgi:hypothetical protein